jgi:UPF0176 protein
LPIHTKLNKQVYIKNTLASGLYPEFAGDQMSTQTPKPGQWFITTFYKFKKITNLDLTQKELEDAAHKFSIKGLLILGTEGINCTCSSPSNENLTEFKKFICEYFDCKEIIFKNSSSSNAPFRKFKVKQREEIVTIGAPDLFPEQSHHHHLTPEQWNQVLKTETDFVLVDTRNWYETKIGTFNGAVDPNIEQFTDFPQWVENNIEDKSKKMLIFCTGGIRCEKGILELEKRGYKNVYQLEGGILKYLEQYPNDQFKGECFVFDHRVAVKQDLTPSDQYSLCPHCGQPSSVKINCKRCDSEALVCEKCLSLKPQYHSCSKHCGNQLEMNPAARGKPQVRDWRLGAV